MKGETMNRVKFDNLLKTAQKTMSKRSPEILTGVGIAGIIMTVIFTVEATRTAEALVKEEKRKKTEEIQKDISKENANVTINIDDIELTPLEIVKTTWKPFVPVVVTCGVSIGCIMGINSVHIRRYLSNNAAWATAYQLSANAMTDYREKVIETIGEKKEKPIHDAFVKERVEKNINENKIANVQPTNNVVLFYDEKFGQTFYSTPETVDAAVNAFNDMLNTCEYGSLNEFYDNLNIKGIGIGETLGWNRSRDGLLTVLHNDVGMTPSGCPCFVINYGVAPKYGYHKEHPTFSDNY